MTQSIKKEMGKYGLVGVFNTLLDFVVLNFLSLLLGIPKIPANIISTTLAMSISFELNRKFVFQKEANSRKRQVAMFLAVTAFGLYVIQSFAILLLTELWLWPLETAFSIVSLVVSLDKEFVILNGAKAFATAFSMVWNFVLYKKMVFKDV